MVILRDDKRIARMRKISQYTSLVGIAALLAGLGLVFWGDEQAIIYQLLALGTGWTISQVGIYLAHRYVRQPRPDEVLDDALKSVARDGRLYHHLLPAPHVLLLPIGVIILNAKYQTGRIAVEGDKWKQRGIGLRRFFGQEGLGNPTKETDALVGAMANYIRKNAPEVAEVPIAPLIVFTAKKIESLETENSRIPAMRAPKLRGFLREKKRSLQPMPAADYAALRAAFDKKAAHLLEIEATNGDSA